MGSAPSSQRGGKATQSETAPRVPTDTNMPMDMAQVANMTKEHLTTSNPELRIEDAHNTRGAALIPPAINYDTKKGDTSQSKPIRKNAAALASSTTCADATNFATKYPEHATGTPSSPLGSILSLGFPKPPDTVSQPQTLATPQVVTSPYTRDAPNQALALDRNILSTVKQADTRNPKVGVRPRKRPPRMGRGRGKDKGTDAPALEETENIPPPATREDKSSHHRRGRRPGRAGTRAVRRGRSENRAGGTETIDSEEIAVSQSAAEGVSGDSKPTSRRANAGRTRGNGRQPSASFRPSKAPKHLSSRARADTNVLGALTISEAAQDGVSPIEEDRETLEVAKVNHAKADDEDDKKDRVVPVQIAPPTDNGTPVALNERAEFPVPTTEVNVSIVPSLPSSTRRRAKEYFQRRTRERSVDAETGPPRRGAMVAEQGRGTNGEEPNPRLRTKEEASTKKRPARWSVPVSNKNHDQFAFDPEASPFTPNATSSPRQGSLSSVGVQSFSSPTPLPPHGNRKVAPLTLVQRPGKSNTLETIDSSQPIPVTSRDTQGEQGVTTYAYYAGTNQAQLQAEQLAIMRLQAYYSWLAGNIPTPVGAISATEHMDMSGGGGGLSGGVALGRQGGLGRGRGKAQSRNASGAYAHPKEHVVYSPREHERTQLAPGTISQRDSEPGTAGPMKSKKDEPDEKPEVGAQRTTQKWDGSWGLREALGREVGWNWGGDGAGVGGSTREAREARAES